MCREVMSEEEFITRYLNASKEIKEAIEKVLNSQELRKGKENHGKIEEE